MNKYKTIKIVKQEIINLGITTKNKKEFKKLLKKGTKLVEFKKRWKQKK